MHIVMGYHVLAHMQDYWSSDRDLSVPYRSNMMPLGRFEELRAYLPFNVNKQMKSLEDPARDGGFKFRSALDHFNSALSASRQ